MENFVYLLFYLPNIMFGGLGLYLIIYAVLNIVKIYSCNEIIDGYCAEKNRVWKFRRWDINYTFSYRYEGKDYYSKSKYGVTKELFEYLRQGKKYTIYVNSKKPEIFVVERKVTLNEIVEIGLGLMFLAAAVFQFVKTFF